MLRAVLPPASSGGVARPPFAVSLRWAALQNSIILAHLKGSINNLYKYSAHVDAVRAARSLFFGASRFLSVKSPFSELTELQEWAEFCEWMGSVMLWGYEGTLCYYGWAPFDPTCPAGLEALDAKIKEAQNLATKIIEANYESRVQRFSNWVKEQSVGGAGALHKFVKPRMAWSPHGAYQGPEGAPPHPPGRGRCGS